MVLILGPRGEAYLTLLALFGPLVFVLAFPYIAYPAAAVELMWTLLFRNIVLGVAGWGALFVATTGLFLLLLGKKNARVLRASGLVLFIGVVMSLALKLLEGPTGSQGFNDSVSRSLLHWLGAATIFWMLGIRNFIDRTAPQISRIKPA